jgi:hypothetical protein
VSASGDDPPELDVKLPQRLTDERSSDARAAPGGLLLLVDHSDTLGILLCTKIGTDVNGLGH